MRRGCVGVCSCPLCRAPHRWIESGYLDYADWLPRRPAPLQAFLYSPGNGLGSAHDHVPQLLCLLLQVYPLASHWRRFPSGPPQPPLPRQHRGCRWPLRPLWRRQLIPGARQLRAPLDQLGVPGEGREVRRWPRFLPSRPRCPPRTRAAAPLPRSGGGCLPRRTQAGRACVRVWGWTVC